MKLDPSTHVYAVKGANAFFKTSLEKSVGLTDMGTRCHHQSALQHVVAFPLTSA
jgi:hypothetical protein